MPTYEIHPRVGVARVGNSLTEFYLAPETTGGLPLPCDARGNQLPGVVTQFKDPTQAVKRQAARFKVMAVDTDGAATEVTLGTDVVRIRWTAHIANKKACWYTFAVLLGDRMFGEDNSYENQHVALRNPTVTDRASLIVDPGPRSVCAPGERAEFSRYNIPKDYPLGRFPAPGLAPLDIASLGELRMDDAGRLLILGGFGMAAGPQGADISSFAGASGFYDDISDGYVAAQLTLADGSTVDLEPAYILVGSPKYAPELTNIVTVDDNAYDVAIRHLGADPAIYQGRPTKAPSAAEYDPLAGFQPDYRPNFARDIEPLFTRMAGYRWVAQIPSMAEFAFPRFDPADNTERTRAQRERYFGYLRVPVPPENQAYVNDVPKGPNQLLADDGVPLMPLQSGDNSVTNVLISKFLALTPTQYFFMSQWSKGLFDVGPAGHTAPGGTLPIDRHSLANCVGGPLCPGIETTWITRNPAIYAGPFRLKNAHWDGSLARLEEHYRTHGLSPTNDVQLGEGLEPGDLTKQMAMPWQADFFDCTVQTPNMVNPNVTQSQAHDGIQVPPSYYVYWWPPQAPMHVFAGAKDAGSQILDGFVTYPPSWSAGSGGTYSVQNSYNIVPAGQPVSYQRGINSFNQMLVAWFDLGFIVNEGTSDYPNFVESERNVHYLAQGVVTGEK
jgi:L-lysine 6-oxidase